MRRIGGQPFTIVLVALTVIVGAVLLSRWKPFDDDHPDAWDPRVQHLVDAVEDITGRDFEHPVWVRFRTDEEFSESVQADESDLTDEDREEIADTERVGRTLGLLSGEIDLFEQQNDLRGSGILAYYSYDSREIVVRLPAGTTEDEVTEAADIPIDIQVTIAHELTHALQDQLYDLAAIRSEAAETDDGRASAALALIEGHAVWVEQNYVLEELSVDERADYFDANTAAVEEFEDDTADVAPILAALQGLPYATGPALVAAVHAAGGADAVDEAFTDDIPVAEDQFLLPSAYLSGDEPEDLAPAEAPEGTDEIDRGQLGAPTLYFMFATAMQPTEALGLIEGWGNDTYVAYEDGDDVCLHARVVGDDQDGTDALGVGLRAWADARDGATVDLVDGELDLRVCDPGPDVEQAVPGEESIAQIFGRAQQLAFGIEQGLEVDTAECLIGGLYTLFPAGELAAEEASPELTEAITRLQGECV